MNIFNAVETSKVGRNTFDLTHDKKLSTRFGRLTPVCCIDTIPGDKFSIKGNALVRLAPLVAPVMDRADVYIHYFFVPNRLVWRNWENFITGGEDGLDNTVHPFVSVGGQAEGTNSDYFGIPTGHPGNAKWSPMALFGFHKIWDEYYRDQNLQAPFTSQSLVDGDNSSSISTLQTPRYRAWNKDYFTSALPWTQRGPEAMLPLGETADLVRKNQTVTQRMRDTTAPYGTYGPASPTNVLYNAGGASFDFASSGGQTLYIAVEDSHEVDLSTATAAGINDLRRAIKLQEWLELNARGGARYIENIKMHFGVTSSDQRLQRPEYIGGFKAPVKFSEVLQTSSTDATTPQANMAGHAISVGGSKWYKYYCEEHGHIIGIASVMPKASYMQGIERQYRRFDKFDYAWPSFAHIGEQAIENIELYASGVEETDADVFGYQARYAEYKFKNNSVAGNFRSSLDFWHMGRKFSSLPALNENFIKMDPDEVDRIFAVQDSTDELWCQILNQVKVSRKLPVFGTPKIS